MNKISVIIPYYQRQAGILNRAITSVFNQEMPPNWCVYILIVDDGSPSPAELEITDFVPNEIFNLKITKQVNAGVSAARNKGLDNTDDSTAIIAFLDSDDIWPSKHLLYAVNAYNAGHDFTFSDNRRQSHHESYIQNCSTITTNIINNSNGVLNRDNMQCCIIADFPAQLSTVTFRRAIAPDLRYTTELKFAGEDVLYLIELISKSNGAYYNSETCVECGEGINMFFSNFTWDKESFLNIKCDQILTDKMVNKITNLSKMARKLIMINSKKHKDDFAFHLMRRIIKQKGKIPPELKRLMLSDKTFYHWFPISVIKVLFGLVFKTYKPS